jgi:hypothetical protein
MAYHANMGHADGEQTTLAESTPLCIQFCGRWHTNHTEGTPTACIRHSRRVWQCVVSATERWHTKHTNGTLTASRRHSRQVLVVYSVLRTGGIPYTMRHSDGEQTPRAASIAWCAQCCGQVAHQAHRRHSDGEQTTLTENTPLCIQLCGRCHTNHTEGALTASRRHARRVWHGAWRMQCSEQVPHPTCR